ncbi:MAG TPA: rhomboid family intramembrane serine protease [Pseudolabrys sp.]|nr:rhomboid family intramembrane serine protease [Pseudolabrys sp.]
MAGLAFTASAPHSQQALVGASGAIAGVLAAYLMFRPCQKVAVFVPYILRWLVIRPLVRLDAFWILGAWILMQFWSISVQTQDDVAYLAHVGGLVSGAAFFLCCAIARCGFSSASARPRSSRRQTRSASNA